jgi:uncharacterized glyoxalase superfamily protein PhnB
MPALCRPSSSRHEAGATTFEENPMQLSVIAYVRDMTRSVAFYESLGFARKGEASPMWAEFAFGDATFALHSAMSEEPPAPSDRLTLNVTVDRATLDRLHTLCAERGYPLSGAIQDIGFGRFFTVTDPDGLPVTLIEE